ncbi:MAG: zinc ribbon domain-containing protein [Candidatus Aenigmatarchaeota archaeon]
MKQKEFWRCFCINWEKKFRKEFKCPKCGHTGSRTNRLSMSGSGISKFFDVQMNKYIFVSCESCGFTEVYNEKVLENKEEGMTGEDIVDLLFGG